MNKHFPIWFLALLILGIFFFNLLAGYLHLYFLIWWLDIPVHMLGGAWVALTTLVVYFRSQYIKRKDHNPLFVVMCAVSSTLVIGLGWEVYEFVVDRAMDINALQLSDTLKDLCDDLVGGLLATWIFIKRGYNKQI